MHHSSPSGFHQRRDAVWKRNDNGDEDQSDDQLPDIRQVSREVRAQDIHADCTHKRSNQGPAAAERDVDDEFRAEHEARQLGRHHGGEIRVAEARKPGDASERRRKQNFDAGRIDAEVGASLLVIADGDKNTGHLAFDEDVSESAEDE